MCHRCRQNSHLGSWSNNFGQTTLGSTCQKKKSVSNNCSLRGAYPIVDVRDFAGVKVEEDIVEVTVAEPEHVTGHGGHAEAPRVHRLNEGNTPRHAGTRTT